MKLWSKYILIGSAIGAVLCSGCMASYKKLAHQPPANSNLPQLIRFFNILQMRLNPDSLYISGKASASTDGGKNTFTAAGPFSSYPLVELTIKSDNADELNSCKQNVQAARENHQTIDIRGMGTFTVRSMIDPPLNTGVLTLTKLDSCGADISSATVSTPEAIPAADLIAVPERYLNQTSTITGHLVSAVHFGDPVSSFMLQSEGQFLYAFFPTQSLSAESRLALVHAAPGSTMILEGTLTATTPKSLAAQSGISVARGYEFDVSSVVSIQPEK